MSERFPRIALRRWPKRLGLVLLLLGGLSLGACTARVEPTLPPATVLAPAPATVNPPQAATANPTQPPTAMAELPTATVEPTPTEAASPHRPRQAVKLTILHRIDGEGSRFIGAISWGWPQILSNLKTLIETGRTLPLAGPESAPVAEPDFRAPTRSQRDPRALVDTAAGSILAARAQSGFLARGCRPGPGNSRWPDPRSRPGSIRPRAAPSNAG